MEKVIILAFLAAWVAWADEKEPERVNTVVRVEAMTSEEVAARKKAISAAEKSAEDLKELEEKIAKAHGSTTGYTPEAIRSHQQEFVVNSVYICKHNIENVEFRGGYLIMTTTEVNNCPTFFSH